MNVIQLRPPKSEEIDKALLIQIFLAITLIAECSDTCRVAFFIHAHHTSVKTITINWDNSQLVSKEIKVFIIKKKYNIEYNKEII